MYDSEPAEPVVIVIMGVAGSGKTTVGTMLAAALDYPYLDADTLHSPANIAAMARGDALDDAERAPWLAAVRARIRAAHEQGRSLVVGCSALRQSYREGLAAGVPVVWVYLRGTPALIRERLRARVDHFADESLLESQFAALEEPRDAIAMDIRLTPEAIVAELLVRVTATRALHVVDPDQLGVAAAAAVAAVLRSVVARMGRCSLVLSGGDTPRALYRALATNHAATPWQQVHIFWSDERYVPPDDPRSNYGMARATLLDHVPCPAPNIHAMPTAFPDPDAAARAYEATIADYFGGARPSFDLAILGIGEDGHTASLFPHAPALDETERAVLAVHGNAEPPLRLTLTLPVLLASARSWFLVDGAHKAAVVRAALTTPADTHALPAAAVLRAHGNVTWWLDQHAAAQLEPRTAAAWRPTPDRHPHTSEH